MKNAEKLFIIGNGFDIHHNIPSRFDQFYKWLKEKDSEFANSIEDKYEVKDISWWKNFENNLSTLNIDSLIGGYTDLAPDYSSEEFRDRYVLPDTIDNVLEEEYVTLADYFREWITTLPKGQSDCKIQIDKTNAAFFTFNYTDTLQDLYNVPNENILHIHGRAKDKCSELVFGHGASYEDIESRCGLEEAPSNLDPEELYEWYQANQEDYSVQEAQKNACGRVYELRKQVENLIKSKKSFFEELKNIKSIFVYGFSFSEIDYLYLEEIVKNIDISTVKWEISFFSDNDKDIANSTLEKLKIQKENIKFIKLESIQKIKIRKLPFEN